MRLAENTGCKKVAKNRHLSTIAQLCWAISSQLRHVSTIGKKNLLSSNMSSTCPHNMVNFGLLAAEIGWLDQFGVPLQISTGFATWQRYCTASSSGRQPNFAALNRGRHLYSAGRPSRWALAHISCLCMKYLGNYWTYLCQIHMEDVWSLAPKFGGQGQRSRLPGDKKWHSSAPAANVSHKFNY